MRKQRGSEVIICVLFLIFLGASLIFRQNTAYAEISESKIFVPLNGNDSEKESVLLLKVDSPFYISPKIYFQPGDENDIFNKDYPNIQYYSLEIMHQNGLVVSFSSNKGNDFQSKMLKDMGGTNGIEVSLGDVVKLSLAEPIKQKVENADGTEFNNISENFKEMYYMVTTLGFIPVNDAIIFRTYDGTKGSRYNIGFQITSFFSNQLVVGNLTTTSAVLNDGFAKVFLQMKDPESFKFNTSLKNSSSEYTSLTKYTVNSDHGLSIDANAAAQPLSTIRNFNSQIVPNKADSRGLFSGPYGSIYRVYSKEPGRALKFSKYSWEKLSQAETYYEYTADELGALKELDFNKVEAKNVTLELGSDASLASVTDFSTVSSYTNVSSSFGSDIKTDTLGTYDLPIIINQNLTTDNNYFTSSVISKVTVVDTTKPTGTVKPELSVAFNKKLEFKDMFSNVNDNSGTENLTYSYVGPELDTTKIGKQIVTVRVQDSSGNYMDFTIPIDVISGEIILQSMDMLNFGTIQSGLTSKSIELTTNQSADISIQDERGTNEGWVLQAKISEFTPKNKDVGKAFSAGIKIPKGTVKTNGVALSKYMFYDVTLSKTLQNVIIAPEGQGLNTSIFTLGTKENPVSLVDIPSTIYLGSYDAILTWSIVIAPS